MRETFYTSSALGNNLVKLSKNEELNKMFNKIDYKNKKLQVFDSECIFTCLGYDTNRVSFLVVDDACVVFSVYTLCEPKSPHVRGVILIIHDTSIFEDKSETEVLFEDFVLHSLMYSPAPRRFGRGFPSVGVGPKDKNEKIKEAEKFIIQPMVVEKKKNIYVVDIDE